MSTEETSFGEALDDATIARLAAALDDPAERAAGARLAAPDRAVERMDAAEAELARSREAARTLAKVVTGQVRAMEAARIELAQGSAGKAMQWILNSLPDVWDDPETKWDGKESADEWWDRTDSFYREAEARQPVAADPVQAAVDAELEEAVRERNTAEAQVARIAAHCRQRLDMAIVQDSVSDLCRDILAIIHRKEEAGNG